MKNQKKTVGTPEQIIAEQLRQITRIYVLTVKYRNKFNNLIRTKLEFVDNEKHKEKWDVFFTNLSSLHQEMEKEIKKEMKALVLQHPWGKYLMSIRGIAERVAAGLIGEFCGAIYGSIEKDEKEKEGKTPKSKFISWGPRQFEGTANVWAFAGFSNQPDGKAMKRRTGQAYPHNKYLKQTLYQFVEKQIMLKGDYYEAYKERKEYERKKAPELSKGHIDNRAKRYTIKKFLSEIKHKLIDGSKEAL